MQRIISRYRYVSVEPVTLSSLIKLLRRMITNNFDFNRYHFSFAHSIALDARGKLRREDIRMHIYIYLRTHTHIVSCQRLSMHVKAYYAIINTRAFALIRSLININAHASLSTVSKILINIISKVQDVRSYYFSLSLSLSLSFFLFSLLLRGCAKL